MNIAVLGTGMVGQSLAGRLSELGHTVVVGTRDPQASLARTEPDGMGNPPFSAWHATHPGVGLATFADAARGAELIVLATNGGASLAVLGLAGADNLAGKVLLDISNPLDFSAGFPPTLFVKDSDSLGETIQRAYPDAKVVKSLNTLTAALMVDPRRSARARRSSSPATTPRPRRPSTGLLTSFGHDDVIDLGDLSTARGTEMLLPVWLRLMGSLGTGMFNFKIVR